MTTHAQRSTGANTMAAQVLELFLTQLHRDPWIYVFDGSDWRAPQSRWEALKETHEALLFYVKLAWSSDVLQLLDDWEVTP